MNTALRVGSALFLGTAVVLWAHGVFSQPAKVTVDSPLTASVGSILPQEKQPFDATGTIVIDPQAGAQGATFLLYTEQGGGRPEIRTKRLVFRNNDECAVAGLPCATDQATMPLADGESVRIIGTVENERIEVQTWYRL